MNKIDSSKIIDKIRQKSNADKNKEIILFVYLMQFAAIPTRGFMTLIHLAINIWHWKNSKSTPWHFSHFKWQIHSSLTIIILGFIFSFSIIELFRYRVILKYRVEYCFDLWIFVLSIGIIWLLFWYVYRIISGILAYSREVGVRSLFSRRLDIGSANHLISSAVFLLVLFWLTGGVSLIFAVLSIWCSLRIRDFRGEECRDFLRHVRLIKWLSVLVFVSALPWILISFGLVFSVYRLNPISNYEELIPFFFAALQLLAGYLSVSDITLLFVSMISFLITNLLSLVIFWRQVIS